MPENEYLKNLKDVGFDKQEYFESSAMQIIPSRYPQPLKRYRLVWERMNLSVEEAYFFILKQCRHDWGYPPEYIEKTEDLFSAAENSAFFGVSQQRLGLQQDKVSQFLATIGKMTKEMFQLVREIRILKERLTYYEDSWSDDRKKAEAAEITLKGVFIDMVEGGAKNPSSVYGMARELQFTTLPDLFFSTHPKTKEQVSSVVDTERAGFNRKVREVLKRKLYSYLVWKEKTFRELTDRHTFTLKYLRQHYDIIRLYIGWVKPYLRHIKRLHLDEARLASPDLISAFEGSMVEVEFIAKKFAIDPRTPHMQNKQVYSVILAHFLFRTRPQLTFQQEGYQRGPVHVGKLEINLRAYTWTQKEIDKYKKLKMKEDHDLIRILSKSLQDAMDALGGDLEAYLEEAGEKIKKEKEPEEAPPKRPGLLEPFLAAFVRVGPKMPKIEKPKKPTSADKEKLEKETASAKAEAMRTAWECYKNFKKAHGFIAW
ncbi:hypothetical protein KY345_06385 [Candidatus Woesearchaeota archaeon]|nr:hypothetical protein [Candidatus Woesearchaeota archaeon]